MDFWESDEHRDLRAAVGPIAAGFGGVHYTEHARAREPLTELWTTLGDAGFIGVNMCEEGAGFTQGAPRPQSGAMNTVQTSWSPCRGQYVCTVTPRSAPSQEPTCPS